MFAYCVHELRLCEQAAFSRIRAARAAREFPHLFMALAEGRVHLSAVVLLAPCLTPENAAELIEAATHKSKSEIEILLAERFPRPDVPTRIRALPRTGPSRPPELPRDAALPAPGDGQLFPGIVEPSSNLPIEAGQPVSVWPAEILPPDPNDRPRLTPLAPGRFALKLTMSQELHDKLRRAQRLLGHRVPSGDLAEVLDRALDVAIPRFERQRFAATDRPRPSDRPSTDPRHIPAGVKREVWERDGGRCTFVSEDGVRCPAVTKLEFDHVQAVAHGGAGSVENLRLRCRAHNQFEAERTFGAEFMRQKREEAP